MNKGQNGLVSTLSSGRDIEITCGLVRLRLIYRDGGYALEFHAKKAQDDYSIVLSSIHKDLITSSEHRVCASPMISGDRPHLFGVCRESLRMIYSEAEILSADESGAVVRLTGEVIGHKLTCEIVMRPQSRLIHVSISDELPQRRESLPLVEYLMSSLAFLPDGQFTHTIKSMDHTWVPALCPQCDNIIGDESFTTPAIIVQRKRIAAAMIADTGLLASCRPMPAALDLDCVNGLLAAPLLSYGFCGYEPTDDARGYRHDMTMARRIPCPVLSYGYYLYIDGNCAPAAAHCAVSREAWDIFARPALGASICRSYALPKPERGESRKIKDTRTGAYSHESHNLLVSAKRYLSRYSKSSDKADLKKGRTALDLLCMNQCLWNQPWRDFDTFGLCILGNCAPQFDAQLSAHFGLCAMRYGAILGDRHYFERGAVAFRAATNAGYASERITRTIQSEFGEVFVHTAEIFITQNSKLNTT